MCAASQESLFTPEVCLSFVVEKRRRARIAASAAFLVFGHKATADKRVCSSLNGAKLVG